VNVSSGTGLPGFVSSGTGLSGLMGIKDR